MDITFAGRTLKLQGTQVKIGDTGQEFTALGTSLRPVKLSDFAGKIKILNILPSTDAGMCENQIYQISTMFRNSNVVVLNITNDLPFAYQRWKEIENGTDVVFLSDYNGHEFGMKYGTLIKELKLQTNAVIILNREDKVVFHQYMNEIKQEVDFERIKYAVQDLLK